MTVCAPVHPPTSMHPRMCACVPQCHPDLWSCWQIPFNSLLWMHEFLLKESQKLLLPFCTRSSCLNTHKYIYRQHTVYKELIEFFFFSTCKGLHFRESWIFLPTRSLDFLIYFFYVTYLQQWFSNFSNCNAEVDVNNKGRPGILWPACSRTGGASCAHCSPSPKRNVKMYEERAYQVLSSW